MIRRTGFTANASNSASPRTPARNRRSGRRLLQHRSEPQGSRRKCPRVRQAIAGRPRDADKQTGARELGRAFRVRQSCRSPRSKALAETEQGGFIRKFGTQTGTVSITGLRWSMTPSGRQGANTILIDRIHLWTMSLREMDIALQASGMTRMSENRMAASNRNGGSVGA